MTRIKASTYPVEGIKTIALAPDSDYSFFSSARNPGPVLAELESSLRYSNFFELCPTVDSMKRGTFCPRTQQPADGVILLRLEELRVQTNKTYTKRTKEIDTPQGKKKVEEKVPEFSKEGSIRVKLKLFRGPTNQLLAERPYYSSFTTSAERWPDSDDSVANKLVQNVVKQMMSDLVPHPENFNVSLDVKDDAVKPGVDLAKSGSWDAARGQWDGVLQKNPQNHAAWYLIGVYFEYKGNVDQARHFYEKAFLISQEKLYRQALDRINSHSQDKQKFEQDMKGRN